MKCILLLSFVALCYSYQYQYGPAAVPLPYGGIFGSGAGYGTVFPYTSIGITGYPNMEMYMKRYGGLWPSGMFNTWNTYGKQNIYSPWSQITSGVQQTVPALASMTQAEREILEQQEQLQQQQILQLQQVYQQQQLQQLQNYPWLQNWWNLTPFQSRWQSSFQGPLTGGYGYTAPWTAPGYGGFQIPMVA